MAQQTAKEKAQELVWTYYHHKLGKFLSEELSWEIAKQCALIAVDEIIKALGTVDKMYWKEVKQEIEKL